MRAVFEFVTDTATLCIFDPESLKHRLSDDADWWSDPEEEVAEVNAANVLFLGLGDDGKFTVEVLEEPPSSEHRCVAARLKSPSGRVFLGSGEEVTGDDLEPECVRGGGFIKLGAGSYQVIACRMGNVVQVHFSAIVDAVDVRNDRKEPIRL